jgi:hypothetical protein
MRMVRSMTKWAAAYGAVLALSVTACGTANEADRDRASGSAESPATTSADRNNASPKTLTGCLQQGDGDNDFILTQVNEQPGPVATSGEKESSEVQQKQQEAAARSYKLSGGREQLRDLVGHQVRVTGTVSDRGEAQSGDEKESVDQDDLATMEVSSAESVANACGSGGARR